MKKTKIVLSIFLIFVFAAALFISIGIYLDKISKPQYIFSKGIDIYKNKLDNYNKNSNDLYLKDKYSIKGTIDFELDSEYYKKSTNEEDIKIRNLINNLNNLDTSFIIQKNKSKNMGYMELSQKIGNENILESKYYISDSTKYYFVKDIVDDYINDGSCNYFENLNSTTTERDNIEYITDVVIESLKNNLKDEYFTKKEGKNTYTVSIKLTNDNINEILNNIQKDLKNDKKAKNILNNINKEILSKKINKTFLQKDEYYKITLYTTKILHKPLKYKIEYVSNTNNKTYLYEGNDNKGVLYYSEDNELRYKINIELNSKEIKAKIKNASNKEVGEFRLEKNNYNTTITYTYNENKKKIDLIYSTKYTKVKENTSFINTKNLSFKIIDNKETKLNGNITAELKVDTKFTILQDISNAKLKTNLTDQEKEKLNNIYNDVKNRLER